MKKVLFSILIFAVFFSILSFTFIQNEKKVADFKLLNVDGKYVSLADYPKAKGFIVVFTCNHCPFAKLYPDRLNALQEKYAKKDIPVIAISSTDTISYEEDSFNQMILTAKENKFTFPYLYDGNQAVAKNFNAQKTPHAYVIWKEKKQWVIKYNGAIDNNGAEPEKVTEPYVEQAVDALLLHKKIKMPETKSIGCQIYFRN